MQLNNCISLSDIQSNIQNKEDFSTTANLTKHLTPPKVTTLAKRKQRIREAVKRLNEKLQNSRAKLEKSVNRRIS